MLASSGEQEDNETKIQTMSMQTTTRNAYDPLDMTKALAAEFASRADEADRAGKMPTDDVRALKSCGYLTLNIPREYGGMGLSMEDCTAAHLEIAQGSASTALLAAMQLQLFGHAFETHQWSDEVLARLARAAIEESAVLNFAASEPALGSPSRGNQYKSCAEKIEGGWRINGHKSWLTGGRHLTHMLVRLMVGDQPGLMVVRGDAPGIEWRETWGDSLCLRASDTNEAIFSSVIVPEDARIEEDESRASQPNAWFAILVGAVYLGSALAARNTVIRFTLERVPTALGKPIATLPKIQRQIGEMDIALQAARALMMEAARAWSQQSDPAGRTALFPRIAAAKHNAVESAILVTDLALKVAGGQGITSALPLERYFRDVRAGSMQPPSGDTALEIVGRGAINAFGQMHDLPIVK